MSFVLIAITVLLGVHLVAAAIATRIIAARIEAENPPGGVFVKVAGGHLHLYDLPAREGEQGPAILLIHGATSNARDLLLALGPDLSKHHRVIAIDRPGHGWSDRPDGRADASPARQAALIAQALDALGIGRVVVVGHSLAGAAAANFALDQPSHAAGLVLLAGATHRWPGGITWYYRLAAIPVLGDLFVETVMTPIGAWGLEAAAGSSFAPLQGPADYATASSAALVLRPNEFRWNGQDVAALKDFVTAQSPRYSEIRVPTSAIASEEDSVVSATIHSRAFAAAVPGAHLVILQGKGHQIHYTATDVVVAEIERVAMATR